MTTQSNHRQRRSPIVSARCVLWSASPSPAVGGALEGTGRSVYTPVRPVGRTNWLKMQIRHNRNQQRDAADRVERREVDVEVAHLGVNDWSEHLPTEEPEQDELDDAAACELGSMVPSPHAAEINTAPDQHTNHPNYPKQ